MRAAISTVLLLGLLGSCQSDKLLLNNVSTLSIHPEDNASLNVGSTFQYTIYAELKTGETKKVKNDAFISFPDNRLSDAGHHRARINTPLEHMDVLAVPVTVALEIGTYHVETVDTIDLNFKSPIVAIWENKKGNNGAQPRASAATLFGRDGLEGRPGSNGQNGTEGRHFTGYLWEQDKELRMILICDSTQQQFCYRSLRRDTVIIDLSGSDAGNGGMGGKGGDGKNGKANKTPGNGANGGIGGNGGNGGNGGSLVLFLHPNVAFLDQSIALINKGGMGGDPGMGGAPGKAGKPFNGQKKQNDGKVGASGTAGKQGEDGPPLVISKVHFDFRKIIETNTY